MLFIIESQRKRYLEYKNGKGERKLPKHIYLVNNRYTITKWIDGKHTYFKSFGTLTEAVEYRDRLIANDWKPLDLTEEEIIQESIQKYYQGIYLSPVRKVRLSAYLYSVSLYANFFNHSIINHSLSDNQ